MIKLKKRGKEMPGIMLSPMIDMMFLLLIFFIVSTMYLTEENTIPVKLPQAASSEQQNIKNISVTIKADGTYWIDGEQASEAKLIEWAKREKAANEKITAVVFADGAVQYNSVIHLLDILKSAGIKQTGLAVEKGGQQR